MLPVLTADKKEFELNSLKYTYPSKDPRIVRELKSIDLVIPMLIQHDKDMEETRFLESEVFCEICYDSKKGSQFYRLYGCSHLYCKECLNGYCEMHVKEGTVQNLKLVTFVISHRILNSFCSYFSLGAPLSRVMSSFIRTL